MLGRHAHLAAICMTLVASAPALATSHLVRAGDEWSKLAERALPGDEIILMPGTHRGARLELLRGDAQKPIVIRPADLATPARIDAGDTGIELAGAQHVIVDSIVIVGAKRCGVLIERLANTPSTHIELRNVYVAKTGDEGHRDAIRVAGASTVTLDRCRIESWFGAGVHIHASDDVAVRTCEFIGGAKTPDRIGIAVDGGSRRVTLERLKFGQGLVMCAAIGLPETDSLPARSGAESPATEVPALADTVTLDRSIAQSPQRFVALGSCRNVVIRANTILGPTATWEVAATGEGWAKPEATIVSNLIWWEPGALKRFAFAAPGAESAGISVEVNLWWSRDLATAKQLFGDFVGSVKAPQITDVDPKLDNYFEPTAEAAKAFGRNAP